ncbi:MAG: type IV pilus assembly protein PilM [Actinomycetota bacterium]|nr:type IV pilus assembly protein PilM [Actinomycetota bacterium]
MRANVVGLKIGASRLSAARLVVNGRNELVQLAQARLEPGVVTAGEVRDVPALASALQAFFKDHKLPRRRVRLGVASNRVGVRTIELTDIDEPRQLANAIRFRAQEVLPIPFEDAVLDFHVLPRSDDEVDGMAARVVVAVAHRELIDAYVEAARYAGVRLERIDLEAFALLRALVPAALPHPEEEPSALVAISIGAERSVLAVSDGKSCDFSRVIDWGGTALTRALAKVIGESDDAAELLKGRLSLTLAADGIPGVTPEQSLEARATVDSELRRFAREIVSSLQFYQSQPTSLGIREIVLAGGTSQLAGIDDALRRLVGVRVRVGNPASTLTVGKRCRDTYLNPSFAVPIGLAIGR